MTATDPGALTDIVTRLSPTKYGASMLTAVTSVDPNSGVLTVNAGSVATAESVNPDLHATALYTIFVAAVNSSTAVPVKAVDPAAHPPVPEQVGAALSFR